MHPSGKDRRMGASFASTISGSDPNVHDSCSTGQVWRNDEGRTFRHSRFFARHRFRMVRFLSLRIARRHHRCAVLQRLSAGDARYLRAARLRRRLPGSPVRRHRVRTHRRHRRTQIHLPRHHPDHGSVDLHRRPAAERCDDRLCRAGDPDRVAPGARSGARRRIRRSGDLCGRACAAGQTRLLHLVHSDHGDARPVPVAAGDPVHPHGARRSRLRRMGLAHSVPGVGASARPSRSGSGCA